MPRSLEFVGGAASGAAAGGPEGDLFWAWAASTMIGLYIVQDGQFIWVNEQFQRDLGYDATTLQELRSLELVHPDDRDLVRANAVSMLKGTTSTPYEYRFVTRDGDLRWALETAASVRYAGRRAMLGNFMDITDRKRSEEQLAHRAFHDPLTELPNRALYMDRLTRALALRERYPGEVAVLYLDLDGFKNVNDLYGHHAGDVLLAAVAKRLAARVRGSDTVARFGGDEFVVAVEGVTGRETALGVADKLCATIARPFIVAGHRLSVTVSIGVALSEPSTTDPEELLRAADTALYRAKAHGKARAVFAESSAGDPLVAA